MKNLLFGLLLGLVFSGCSTIAPNTVEQQYDLAIQNIDKASYAAAIPLLDKIIQQNPGTRYAVYAHLKKADALMASGNSKYPEAETNYRIFLNYSAHSHLVPYVLSQLIQLNYHRNEDSFFDKDYKFTRDPDHFKKIIAEYQRFYLLYPKSLYLENAKKYLDLSTEALAEHEFLIGNWYYGQQLFTPAIARYSYVLHNYPGFIGRQKVIDQLIQAYRKNQQPKLADELEEIQNIES